MKKERRTTMTMINLASMFIIAFCAVVIVPSLTTTGEAHFFGLYLASIVLILAWRAKEWWWVMSAAWAALFCFTALEIDLPQLGGLWVIVQSNGYEQVVRQLIYFFSPYIALTATFVALTHDLWRVLTRRRS